MQNRLPRRLATFFLSSTSLVFVLLGLVLYPAFFTSYRAEAASASDLLVYGDALAANWQNWSWSTTLNFANSTPIHQGSASLAVTYSGAWAGASLRAPTLLTASNYTEIAFWAHGGASGSRTVNFYIQQTDTSGNSPAVTLNIPAGTWTYYSISMSQLGNPSTIARLNFQDTSGTTQPVYYLDDISLVGVPAPSGGISGTIQINAAGTITNIDSRLLGTNVAAWLGGNRLADNTFRARTAASGLTVLRLPGGSWSNTYGWLSCEMGANQPGALTCGSGWEGWAAKPTDFLNFVRATGKQGMWVVSPNATAQESAAAVAFFNATPANNTLLGVDIHGTNWYTAGRWAQLRVDHGNVDPLGIKLWAVGNEVYGGKPGSGAQCQSWGWEDVWSCDGTEYVNGISGHEGYTTIRNAMRAVDATIQVGAVGIYPVNDYTNWGNEVIAGAGASMDFYDIHPYAYNALPATMAEALAQPQSAWSAIVTDLRTSFNNNAGGRAIPIGVTEYNITAMQDNDPGLWMTRAVDGLFVADTIGQMAQKGVALANQWDLANGRAGNGTEYGLMHLDNGWFRSPQYYAFPLWARFGSQMLSFNSSLNAAQQLSVYAGRVNANTISLLAINKTATPITTTISIIDGGGTLTLNGGSVDQMLAASLTEQSVSFNGVSNPADDLSNAPSMSLSASGATLSYAFPGTSITLLRMQTGAVAPTATNTPLPTATNTSLPTATNTPLPTATNTPLPTATNTPLPTATKTPLPTATNTSLPTATNTSLPTATNTSLPTATRTSSPTATRTPLSTGTRTPSPTPTRTATRTPTPTATPKPLANLTVVHDGQPDDALNFTYGGSFGTFYLDDITPSDGDSYPNSQLFSNRSAGSYTVSANSVTGWTLNQITCNVASKCTVNLAQRKVTIKVVAGDNISATFAWSKNAAQSTQEESPDSSEGLPKIFLPLVSR